MSKYTIISLILIDFVPILFIFNLFQSPKSQRVPMTHFHLMGTQKHKIWSVIVLNMAKYTIISLILINFVPIFFIFNLFRRMFRGSFRFSIVKLPLAQYIFRATGKSLLAFDVFWAETNLHSLVITPVNYFGSKR